MIYCRAVFRCSRFIIYVVYMINTTIHTQLPLSIGQEILGYIFILFFVAICMIWFIKYFPIPSNSGNR